MLLSKTLLIRMRGINQNVQFFLGYLLRGDVCTRLAPENVRFGPIADIGLVSDLTRSIHSTYGTKNATLMDTQSFNAAER
jgi:hypothetical protein